MPIMSPIEQLRMFVAADQDPTLSDQELHYLLETNQLAQIYSSWEASTAYVVGSKVVPSPRNGQVFQVTVAGTSGTSEPAFSETTAVTDGTVTWEFYDVEASYDIRKAAATGWRIKAGKVANRFDMKTDVTSTFRSQLYKHCMDMYREYRRASSLGTIRVVNPWRQGYVDPVITNVNAG